jgi:hypothetical protein
MGKLVVLLDEMYDVQEHHVRLIEYMIEQLARERGILPNSSININPLE